MHSSPEQFFFDVPLVDVNAIAHSAMRLIYHGSTHGAFGSFGSQNARIEPLDLDKCDAFKISLDHLSVDPLAEGYQYSLVYLNDTLSENLWNGKKRDASPALKELTRRVQLAESPSLSAKRYRTPFWVKFQKPIYIARYDSALAHSSQVPEEYQQRFLNKYQGFLMRTEKDYPLVRTIFEAYGLKLEERRDVLDHLDGHLQVLAYSI